MIARLHNAWAGGRWADAADRELVAELERQAPGTARLVRATRKFHRRAALWAVTDGGAAGVVFVPAGLEADPEPHEDALRASPSARFVYADPDEAVTLINETFIVSTDPRIAVCTASSRDPAGLLGDPENEVPGVPEVRAIMGVARDRPISVQMQMAVQFWPADIAASHIAAYGRLLPRRSSLVLSAGIAGAAPGEWLEKAGAGGRLYGHSPEDVAGWLEDAGLVMTGPVRDVRAWRPDGRNGRDLAGRAERAFCRREGARIVAAVAVKP